MTSVRAALALSCVLLSAFAGCGTADPAVCGNAIKEDDEDCDRGSGLNGAAGSNCSADCRSVSVIIPQLQVQWTILRDTGVAGYGGANCRDVGAKSARVQLSGPTPADMTIDCETRTRLFSDKLAAGKYEVTVTLLDADGGAVTKAKKAAPVQVNPGTPVPVSIDFGLDELLAACTGSLRVFPAWGVAGTWCTSANPAVQKQAYHVVKDGEQAPVSGKTTMAGTQLDGTQANCYTPLDGGVRPDSAAGLDCGIYQMRIQGYAAGQEAYCGKFTVFVGPGTSSQIWSLTVPPIAMGACD